MHFIDDNEFFTIVKNYVDYSWYVHFGYSFFIELHFSSVIQIIDLHCKLFKTLGADRPNLHPHIEWLMRYFVNKKKRLCRFAYNSVILRNVSFQVGRFYDYLIGKFFPLDSFYFKVDVGFYLLNVHFEVNKVSWGVHGF